MSDNPTPESALSAKLDELLVIVKALSDKVDAQSRELAELHEYSELVKGRNVARAKSVGAESGLVSGSCYKSLVMDVTALRGTKNLIALQSSVMGKLMTAVPTHTLLPLDDCVLVALKQGEVEAILNGVVLRENPRTGLRRRKVTHDDD